MKNSSSAETHGNRSRDARGCFVPAGGVVVSNPRDFPDEHKCNACGQLKLLNEMVVIFNRKEKLYHLRPLCKSCHNKKERGHRREWKRNYLRAWRKRNRTLNDSYWRGNDQVREKARVNAARRLQDQEFHEATLIQGRLRRRLDMRVSLAEAKDMLKRFGRCYPSRFGLTEAGLRECERIRSRQRRSSRKRFSLIEIRMMVYEDGHYIKPNSQIIPYQSAAEQLRRWQASHRFDSRQQGKAA